MKQVIIALFLASFAIPASAATSHLTIVGSHCFVRSTTAQQAQQSPGLDPQSQSELAQIVGGAAEQISGNQNVGTVTDLISGVLGLRRAKPTPSPAPPVSLVTALISNTGNASSKSATLEVDYSDRVPDMLLIPALRPVARVQISHVITGGESYTGTVSCEVVR